MRLTKLKLQSESPIYFQDGFQTFDSGIYFYNNYRCIAFDCYFIVTESILKEIMVIAWSSVKVNNTVPGADVTFLSVQKDTKIKSRLTNAKRFVRQSSKEQPFPVGLG